MHTSPKKPHYALYYAHSSVRLYHAVRTYNSRTESRRKFKIGRNVSLCNYEFERWKVKVTTPQQLRHKSKIRYNWLIKVDEPTVTTCTVRFKHSQVSAADPQASAFVGGLNPWTSEHLQSPLPVQLLRCHSRKFFETDTSIGAFWRIQNRQKAQLPQR